MIGLHAYHCSLKLGKNNAQPFYALLAAALRLADAGNLAKLAAAFPEEWKELQDRYNAPMGVLPQDGEINMDLLRQSLRQLENQR